MRRRELLAAVAGSLLLSADEAIAQPAPDRRRLIVLMDQAADNPLGLQRLTAFQRGLSALGWTSGRNVETSVRWGANSADATRAVITGLLALKPNVIVVAGSPAVGVLQRATHDVPIVFTSVADPVAAGFVASMAAPGGNITGFTVFDNSMSGKWVELLKEIQPRLAQVLVVYDPAVATGLGQLAVLQAAAAARAINVSAANVREATEIRQAMSAMAGQEGSGVIVTASPAGAVHKEAILASAAEYGLPAIYPYSHFVVDGGLMSYGPDLVEPFASAAAYVDRILKGESPASLPVQAPTKYELFLNLKTARALGLQIAPSILLRADEVIE